MKTSNQIQNEAEQILNQTLESSQTAAKTASAPAVPDIVARKLETARKVAEHERAVVAERDQKQGKA